MDADSLGLFVNTNILHGQPPQKWDDFLTAARLLTNKNNNNNISQAGAALGTYDNIEHAPDIISLLMVEQGVTMAQFTNDSDAESSALAYYLQFAAPNQNQNTWDDTLDNSLTAFSEGKLAMYFGYSWDIFTLEQLNPQLHFAVYPTPVNYGDKQTIASYWVEGVSSKTQNSQAAMTFMHFLTQKSTLEELYAEESKVRKFGEPYPRADMASLLAGNLLVYPFVKQLPQAVSSYFVSQTDDGTAGINSRSDSCLQTYISSLSGQGGVSAQTAVQNLDACEGAVYQQYGIQ
jgi:multiple sugar transport system substrate-binding protein